MQCECKIMDRAIFIPETAPFSIEQRAWLNGFFAGLFGNTLAPLGSESVKSKKPLLILFGSQSGNSEMLAKRFRNEAKQCGYEPRVLCMDKWQTINWASETTLLVIVSTWGDGDVPDNAREFWKHLAGPSAPKLEQLRYSVLALGDTNYGETFCQAGKSFDRRFEELGAKRIVPRMDCNLEFEPSAKSWFGGVCEALGATGDRDGLVTVNVTPQTTPAEKTKPTFNRENPFPAKFLANRRLTADGSNKDTRHIEISIAGSGLTYKAGDALGIHPANDPALVAQILDKLKCDGEEEVPAASGGNTSLGRALLRDYEITRLPFALLEAVAAKQGTAALLDLAADRALADKYLGGRNVLDFVSEFDVQLPPKEFVRALRKLSPRLYSIASSPKKHGESAHLTVGVVQFEGNGRMHQGLCSNYLAERVKEGAEISIFMQAAHGFALPADGKLPIIMVGPGTGIAPFRGFLHEREATDAKGKNWLIFGEQHSASDFLYREELEQMLSSGSLTRLDTAFSRDQEEKVYVQHRMLEQANELWKWLQEGAHFYVCGDARRMAKDVDAALHQVAQRAGGLSVEASMEFVDALKEQKRYQRDVY
jgi:sulfite reductase (NADPH) flavoprotein alpha-component